MTWECTAVFLIAILAACLCAWLWADWMLCRFESENDALERIADALEAANRRNEHGDLWRTDDRDAEASEIHD